MPQIVTAQLPWLKIDHRRIYAVGGSMGGQETLLIVARYPHLLAGVVAVDAVTDLSRQYWNYPKLGCNDRCLAMWGPIGVAMQRLARKEVGGTPATEPTAYAERSPLWYARTMLIPASRCRSGGVARIES